MCIVYEAEHVGLRQGLALKVLKPELAGDPGCVTRFEREARASAQLRSPNVAKVFDVDYLPSGQPYITMELLVGHDLGAELGQSGRLPLDLAVDYVRQACSGIAEAHALGIVHRDLKPENLFLTELGVLTDRKLLKILDFGIAKNISENARRLTAPDAVFGTVDYMSPEQIRSASQVDHRTDLWSLGVILYELLTGRTPYHGDARSVIAQIVSDPVRPPTTLIPDLPPSLVATIMRALEKDPAKRFQSADEMRTALEGYGEFEPITSVIARLPPESVPRRAARSVPSGAIPIALEVTRDARTHASWETKPDRRGWGKTWILMPATAMLLGGAAGILFYRGDAQRSIWPPAPALTAPLATSPASPASPTVATAAETAAAPESATAPATAPPPPTAAPTEIGALAPATPATAPTAPTGATPPPASTAVTAEFPAEPTGKSVKPARPRPPHVRPPPPVPPPTPPAAPKDPPKLPKFI